MMNLSFYSVSNKEGELPKVGTTTGSLLHDLTVHETVQKLLRTLKGIIRLLGLKEFVPKMLTECCNAFNDDK